MGASASVDLRPDDIAEIEDITVYEPKEIKSLYKRFMRLDRGKKGTLAVEDLLMVPEVSMNPLAGRLTCLFDRDSDGRINFRSFASGLSTFSERARSDVRKRAVFRLYDVDSDGSISESDLRAVVDMVAGKSLDAAAVADVVALTMAAVDKDSDGRISFEDFDISLQQWDWATLSSPVKSSSRWERRQDEVAGGMAHSASGVRLSDAVVALQLAAAQEELARLSAPAAAAAAAAAAASSATALPARILTDPPIASTSSKT